MIETGIEKFPYEARYTDWEFVDHSDKATSPVHVTQGVRINGTPVRLRLHDAHPIVVRSHGGPGRTETLLGLTVHPDNVVLTDFPAGLGVDTICGQPVITPKSDDPEFGWSYVDEPSEVRAVGLHFPEAVEPAERWVRVWVQVRSAAFTYAPLIKPTPEGGGPQSSKPSPHKA